MQKLKFINAKGIEIDLTDGDYGITEWNGFSNVDLNLQTQQVPFNDGSVYLDGLLGEREISVTLAIRDDNDLQKRYRLRRELISVLNPKLGEGTLIYTNNYISKQIKAVPQVPTFETHNSNDSGTPKAGLAWTCPSPYWEDLEETELIINAFSGAVVKNEGDVKISPRVQFWGSAVNPNLRNVNNKTQLKIKGTVTDSVADLGFGKKTYNKETLSFSLLSNIHGFVETEDAQILMGTCINKTSDMESFKTVNVPSSHPFSICKLKSGVILCGGNHYFLESVDGGETFTPISNAPDDYIETIYTNEAWDDEFYFASSSYLYRGVRVNGVYTFTNIGVVSAMQLIETTAGTIMGCGIHGALFSYDGTTITEIPTGVTRDLRSLIYNPNNDGNVYIVGDGGTILKWDGTSITNISSSVQERLSFIYYSDVIGKVIICGGEGTIGIGNDMNSIEWQVIGTHSRYYIGLSKLFGYVEIVGEDILIYQDNRFIEYLEYPQNTTCGIKIDDKYYAGGIQGDIYVSENFRTWERCYQSEIVTDAFYFAQEDDKGYVYFITKNGGYVCSADRCKTFKDYPTLPRNIFFNNDIFSKPNGQYYFNGFYYAVGTATVDNVEKVVMYRSEDFKEWNQIAVLNDISSVSSINVFVSNNCLFVVKDNIIVKSDDGEIFTKVAELESSQDVNAIAYYNGYYIISTNEYIYKTTDFTSLETVFSTSDFGESETYFMVTVYNNVLFISTTVINEEAPSYTEMFTGRVYSSEDLATVTLRLTEYGSYGITVTAFVDNKYVAFGYKVLSDARLNYYYAKLNLDYSVYESGWGMAFDNYGRFVYIDTSSAVDNPNPQDSTFPVYVDGKMIYNAKADSYVHICYNILADNNKDLVKNFVTNEILTSALVVGWGDILNVFKDDSQPTSPIFVTYSAGIVSLSALQQTLEIKRDESPIDDFIYSTIMYKGNFCVIGYDTWNHNYSVFLVDRAGNLIKKTVLSSLVLYSYEDSFVENGVCIIYNDHLIWGCKDRDNQRFLVIYNFVSEAVTTISKNIETMDFTIKDGCVISIGPTGVVTCGDMRTVNEVSAPYFILYKFFVNADNYFTGLLNNLGYLNYEVKDNLINNVDALSLSFDVGENELAFTVDSGTMTATVKYRQKYVGV